MDGKEVGAEEEEDALIPIPTTDDNGKLLKVVDGAPTWVLIANAEEGAF